MRETKSVTLLIVDDDLVDVETIKRGLAEMRIANQTRVAKDGFEALEILRGQEGHAPIEKPYLILLDLNMPRMNGIEFLQQVRADEELRKAIVFVLTTSDEDKDKMAAYDLNAAGYVLKTNAGKDFVEALTMLDHFWRYVEFPE